MKVVLAPLVCMLLPAAFAQTGVTVTPIYHASVQLQHANTVIQVDPSTRGDYSHALPADLILVTGAESDHLDPAAIAKIRKTGAPVVIPAAAKEKVPDGIVLANGEVKEVAGVRVESIPAYDLIPGEPFHPKGRGNGYVVTLGGERVLIGGVGECVDELRAVRNIDIAFLSMNLPHGRMTPRAAADCVRAFRPKIVYPYHYRDGSVEEFKAALDSSGVEVRLAKWY